MPGQRDAIWVGLLQLGPGLHVLVRYMHGRLRMHRWWMGVRMAYLQEALTIAKFDPGMYEVVVPSDRSS
jgi:hypothetical protein